MHMRVGSQVPVTLCDSAGEGYSVVLVVLLCGLAAHTA